MKQFHIEFQKIRDAYVRAASQKSGLVCISGVFEECPYVRLYRQSWISGSSGVFFSVWADKNSLEDRRIHYNIHALKMRLFKFHVITSRDFADDFRKKFKPVSSSWPNVRVDYGPLNLMQGWVPYYEESFESDVLELMNQFATLCRIIDQLLEERMVPLRQRR